MTSIRRSTLELCFACTLMFAPAVSAASIEQTTLGHVAILRTIAPSKSKEDNARFNRQMDEAWTYYHANADAVRPILRRVLDEETRGKAPNQLVLLDLGWWLYLNDGEGGRPLALRALYQIDVQAQIIRHNHQQLFEFTHRASRDHAAGLLEFIDRAFLPNDLHVFVPQHAMDLDPTLICAFLYGAYGPEAEAHLAGRVTADANASRTLELLNWLGSEDSVAAVLPVFGRELSEPDYKRALSYMMMLGGPDGRSAMLAIDAARLSPAARDLHVKVRRNIDAQGFDDLRRALGELPGDKRLSDAEVKTRLDAMYANYGRDEETSPLAVLDSKLPRAALLAQLKQIRGRMFHRLSDEALSDVEVTNLLINALQYRPN